MHGGYCANESGAYTPIRHRAVTHDPSARPLAKTHAGSTVDRGSPDRRASSRKMRLRIAPRARTHVEVEAPRGDHA